MINYLEQTGCHDCRHVFVRSEYDEEAQFFCNRNAPPRPTCMSISMREMAQHGTDIREGFRVWDKWSKDREVKPFGICDAYKSEDGDV